MRPERCFTGPSPTQRSPRDSPRVLSHGLFREYQRRRGLGARTGQHQDLPPQEISLKSVTTLRQLAAERGRIPERARRMWCGSTKRLSSVDHFLRIKAVHRLAREDLKKAKASGKSVTVCIGWEKDLAMHRLDLGKIHLEAALAEALCKCRQQEYCSAGFRAGHGLQDDRFRRGRGADSRIQPDSAVQHLEDGSSGLEVGQAGRRLWG